MSSKYGESLKLGAVLEYSGMEHFNPPPLDVLFLSPEEQASSNDVSNTKIEEIKIRFKITPPTRVQDLEHSSCKRIDWP